MFLPENLKCMFNWISFLNLQQVFPVGASDILGTSLCPRFQALEKCLISSGSLSPAEFSSDTEVKWLSLRKTGQ